jgi:hypothetical protein
MKQVYDWKNGAWVLLFPCLLFLHACSPVQLTSAWSNSNVQPMRFDRILVVSFAKDTAKRKLGEDHIRAEMMRHGQVALTSLDVFGPGFADADSLSRRRLLLERGFDGLVTFRVTSVDDDYAWQLNTAPALHLTRSIDEQVVYMISQLYRVKDNKLIWQGLSNSSSTEPTDYMATRYARNIVRDMIRKRVLLTGK